MNSGSTPILAEKRDPAILSMTHPTTAVLPRFMYPDSHEAGSRTTNVKIGKQSPNATRVKLAIVQFHTLFLAPVLIASRDLSFSKIVF